MKTETQENGRGSDNLSSPVRCCGNCALWGKQRKMRCGYELEINLPSGIQVEKLIMRGSSGRGCRFFTPND